jgi:hypothetical protein
MIGPLMEACRRTLMKLVTVGEHQERQVRADAVGEQDQAHRARNSP